MTEQTEGIRRDFRGRPYIWLPDGSKEVTYTRTSTFAKALADGDALSWWKLQRLSIGLILDPRVMAAGFKVLNETGNLSTADEDGKSAIAEMITRGMETGGANAAADWGTTMHHFADLIDFGDGPLIREQWDIEDAYWEKFDQYVEVTKHLTMISAEQFVVNDVMKCAGSYDRTILVGEDPALPQSMWGQTVVGDLKTGQVRWPDHGIQTALYAHSEHYDKDTGKRTPGPVDDASTSMGLIVHLPRPGMTTASGKPVEPSLIPVDLEEGWRLAHLADDVRTARRAKLVLKEKKEGE